MKQEADHGEAAGRPNRGLKGYLLLGLAFLTCPCHLPILLVILAGTGLGVYLRENLALTAIALTGIFIVSLMLGLQRVGSGDRSPRK